MTLAIYCLMLTACGRGDATKATVVPATDTQPNTSTPTLIPTPTSVEIRSTGTQPSPLEQRVETILSQMTLEQKVGQLFVVFFDGSEYSKALDRTIRELNVGGIILFDPNIGSLEELTTLTDKAQTTATQNGAQIPLVVAVDHEGGLINRFGNRLTQFPSNMAVAATGSLENARAEARVMAEELIGVGINMNLAPVVDVNINPDNPVIGIRSFGSDPNKVAQFGTVMIRELQANGMIATAKHFPGHGDTSVDSHTMLPIVPYDRQRLDSIEFLPFRAAIDVGVDTIMTAHVVFPTIDSTSNLPATLSRAVLTDLLRDELGFSGLIATDSLGMGAIDQTFGVADACAMAFQAGADLLMFGNDPGHVPAEQYPAYQNLLALVRNGTISQERLDASVRRILLVKAQRGILDWQPPSLAEISTQVRTSEHPPIADRIAKQSVTLIKNDRKLLPIKTDQRALLVYPEFETELEPAFSKYGTRIDAMPVSINPSQQEITQVISATEKVDVIIVATANARRYPGQIALVESTQNLPTVVLALQSPYDLLAFPRQSTYVTIYGDVPVSMHAAAKVLFGELQPSGKLPVALPDLFPEGYGLDGF
jgi:beta-N-acetylhexosaminidase